MIKQGMQFTLLICLACGALAHGIERDRPGCAPKTPALSDQTCRLRDVVGQSAAASGSINCDSSLGRIGGAENLLTELHAILVYLARTNPAAALIPENPAAEARCIEWMNWLSSDVHAMSYGQIWRTPRFVADEKDFPAVKAKGEQNVREQYAYIESLLADGRDWAVPGGYTVVDAYLLVFYHWGRRIRFDMPALYPAWTRLTKRVAARPAVARVLAHEGAWFKHGGDKAWASQSRRSFHRTPCYSSGFLGVPRDCRRQDRPICDSEPPCLNRVQ